MTHLSQSVNSRSRRLLLTVTLVLFCFPVVAEETGRSAPLTADEVMQRVVQMSELRAKAIENYSSMRTYHLESNGLSHKVADMVVRVDYQAPNTKEFTIVSESGSGTVRKRVFKKLLEAEQESMRDENQRRSAVTSENYTFRLLEYSKTETDEFYVLDAKPRVKDKFLFQGHIWVDGSDFAITRVEGEPAVNPSWWTLKTDFNRTYKKFDDYWLPESNESTTHVRIFGTAVLTITYGEYQITKAVGDKLASSLQEGSNGR
jgi:hypothetical protein